MITESSKVAYAGEDPMNEVGSLGKVLAVSGHSAVHVMWQSGPKVGHVELLDINDVVETRGAQQHHRVEAMAEAFDNSLDMPMMPGLNVRAALDENGEAGLIAALEEAGKISIFAEYAEEAVEHVSARIRQDPGFSEVLAQLDPDEGVSVVSRVASLVLMDQISEGD